MALLMNNNLPILIVGAGPVGLSLGTALAAKGIKVELFEAMSSLSSESRASTLHPPTLEMFNRWGVLDEVISKGKKVDKLQYWDRDKREIVAEFNYSLIAGDTSFPFRLQCPQSTVTRILKPKLEKIGPARVHMGHELLDYKDLGNKVRAVFKTAQGIKAFEGLLLCGADGAHSLTRKKLSLPFEGSTYEDRFLLVPVKIDLKKYYPGIGPVAYLFSPKEWMVIMNLPGLTRLVFRVTEDEDIEEVQKNQRVIQRVQQFIGEEVPIEFFPTSVYRVHRRICEKFRVGNVLLVGDAAHLNNPLGGMGMNSGIHDAYYLAEYIELFLRREDPEILDRYSEKRRRIAIGEVQNSSDKTQKYLSAKSRLKRIKRNKNFIEMASCDQKSRVFLLRASMLESRI